MISSSLPGPSDPGEAAPTIFDLVGGMETFERLAAAFYRRVENDPILRPMFPQQLELPARHLALFLAQRFGGPTTYLEQRGHPRLRMRHLPFQIGQAERDAWTNHMIAAMEEIGIAERERTTMRQYFEDSATFLINAHQGRHGGSPAGGTIPLASG